MDRRNIVMVPFTYVVEGVAKGKQKPEDHHFFDRVPVEVPELSGMEAPLALRVANRRDGFELRTFDDALYLPYDQVFGARAEGGIARTNPGVLQAQLSLGDIEALFASLAAGDISVILKNYPLPLNSQGGFTRAYPEGFEMRFRSVVADHREEARAAAQAVKLPFVTIDGVLHAKEPEPAWTIFRGGDATGVFCGPQVQRSGGYEYDFYPIHTPVELLMEYCTRFCDEDVVAMSRVEDFGTYQWKADGTSVFLARWQERMNQALKAVSPVLYDLDLTEVAQVFRFRDTAFTSLGAACASLENVFRILEGRLTEPFEQSLRKSAAAAFARRDLFPSVDPEDQEALRLGI